MRKQMVKSMMSRMKKWTDLRRVMMPVTRKRAARMGMSGSAASPPPTLTVVVGMVKAHTPMTMSRRAKSIQATLGVA